MRPYSSIVLCLLSAWPALRAQHLFDVNPRMQLPLCPTAVADLQVLDVDADGDRDLVLASGSRANVRGGPRLYLNDGRGGFTDASAARLPSGTINSWSVAAGDVDGDRDPDLVIGVFGSANRLYLNDGRGYFRDASAARLPPDNDGTTKVRFGDMDGDGDLDLIATSTEFDSGSPAQNRQYRNDGAGRFTDVTAATMPHTGETTVAAVLADLDGDRDLDLFCANGYTSAQDRLYLNTGRGRLVDATARLPRESLHATGVDAGDVDGDGDVDLMIANDRASALWLNDGRGRFAPAPPAKFRSTHQAGVCLGDIDLDGDLDAVLGGLSQTAGVAVLFNDGSGGFAPVRARGAAGRINTTVVGLADVDADGDLDLVGGTPGGAYDRLLFNRLRHVWAPRRARIAHVYTWTFEALPGSAPAGQLAQPFVAAKLAARPIRLGSLGEFYLDPTASIPLTRVVIPVGFGRTDVILVIPADLSLVGSTMYSQSAFLPRSDPATWHVSNVVADTIST